MMIQSVLLYERWRTLQGVTGRAEEACDDVQAAASPISWKWAAICALTGYLLLATVVAVSMLLVPMRGRLRR
jgi:hypothetical protein